MRQQRGTHGSVRRVEHPADRGGKTVHRAESGVGERQAAEQAGHRHVRAGFGIAAVLVSPAEGSRRARHSLDGECVGERIGADRDVGLDQLRQCVEARAGGDFRGKIAGELGIDDREARKHERAAEAGLDTVLGRSEDGVARDFGPRARRGRHCDEGHRRRSESLALADDLEVVQRIASIGDQCCNGLAGVNGAAAADGHHDIASLGPGELYTSPDSVDGRLA